MLECLVYVSVASNCKNLAGQADRIAAEAETDNLEGGISGALVAHDGHFIQIVEGRRSALDMLLKRLEDDPRHRDLVLVDRWPIEERRFDGWSLAGVAMNEAIAAEVDALIANPTRCPRVLVEATRSRAIPLGRGRSVGLAPAAE